MCCASCRSGRSRSHEGRFLGFIGFRYLAESVIARLEHGALGAVGIDDGRFDLDRPCTVLPIAFLGTEYEGREKFSLRSIHPEGAERPLCHRPDLRTHMSAKLSRIRHLGKAPAVRARLADPDQFSQCILGAQMGVIERVYSKTAEQIRRVAWGLVT